jgi:hypothetical protein
VGPRHTPGQRSPIKATRRLREGRRGRVGSRVKAVLTPPAATWATPSLSHRLERVLRRWSGVLPDPMPAGAVSAASPGGSPYRLSTGDTLRSWASEPASPRRPPQASVPWWPRDSAAQLETPRPLRGPALTRTPHEPGRACATAARRPRPLGHSAAVSYSGACQRPIPRAPQ